MRSRARNTFLCVVLLSSCSILISCESSKPRDDSKAAGDNFNQNIRPTGPRTPEEELAGLIVPPGFEIELFASEPDIDKPINITFDSRGRMWVASSFEYPFPTQKTGTDRLTIVEDTDGDGKADKFTDVSDTLNIPIGILPLNNGAISFSVPNVYRLTDSNNDDKIESSKVLLSHFGYQDTHGMVSNFIRGYDGWVHACHGFTNRSKFAGSDGDSITLVSGNTFRFRLDGSRVEQLTFGQVNPFGLVFDAFGYVYSTDSHSSPLYQLIRTGDYPHFGKMSNMGFGPDMKSLENEATALCGITQYADVHFPEEYQGNFFIGDAVKSRVHRYSFEWHGSTPVGKSEDDFVKSEDPWFRPVNVKLGPDGAIYVADFYNAIIGHYEVPLDHPKRDKQRGRIWRITYKGKSGKAEDLSKSPLEKLMDALNSDNLPTRMAATDQITDRLGDSAVETLRSTLKDTSTPARKYVHSLWALQRLGKLTDEELRSSVAHSDSLIRVHALRVVLERGNDAGYYEMITNSLKDKSPHVRRTAVESLSKYPGIKSVEAALSVLNNVDENFDTHLYYTARLALRNILRDETTLSETITRTWKPGDASLIAGVVVDVPLPGSATFLAGYVKNGKLPVDRITPAYTQIARFLPGSEIGDIVSQAFTSGSSDVDVRALTYKGLMDGLNQRGGKSDTRIFEKYAPSLAEELLKKYPPSDTSDQDEKFLHQRTAVDIAGEFKVKSLEPVLKQFMVGSHNGWTIRTTALRSLLKIDPANAVIGANIIDNDSIREYQRRITAVMGEFPGTALNKAIDNVKVIPREVQEAVVAALAGSSEGKDLVFKKVREGKVNARALVGARAEELLLSKASPKQMKEFEALTSELSPVSEERQALIKARLIVFDYMDKTVLPVDSGRMIFQQNCGVCHKVGGEIGVAPQLDGIGNTGSHGLVEKIIDPNRNISPAFKNYTIRLKDGTIKSGLFRRDEGAARIFADITGKEFSVSKSDIAEQKQSRYTLMPDTFGTSIRERDFYLLVNYLLTL